MKALLFGVALLFITGIRSAAQKTEKTHNLMISIYENVSLIPRSSKTIVITREDGTQEVTVLREAPDYSLKNFKAREDSVFNLLKTYFDQGWKLVSCTTIPLPVSSALSDYITRYFLSRQDDE